MYHYARIDYKFKRILIQKILYAIIACSWLAPDIFQPQSLCDIQDFKRDFWRSDKIQDFDSFGKFAYGLVILDSL